MLKSLMHFEIDKIKVFVDITLSTFNFPNMSHELSGVHWQQSLYMALRLVLSASILYIAWGRAALIGFVASEHQIIRARR